MSQAGEAVLEEFCAGLAPQAQPPGFIEWCRTVRLVEGPQAGEYYEPESHPGQWTWLQAVDAGGFETGDPARPFQQASSLVLMGPVQDGKTWAGVMLVVLYTLAALVQPVGYGLPDLRLWGLIWQQKIRPALLRSGLGELLPTAGGGSRGGSKPDAISLVNGSRLTPFGAGSSGSNEAQQAGITVRSMAVDELDDIQPQAVERLAMRTAGWGEQSRMVRTGTIKHDQGSHTIAAFESGTMTRNHYQWPCCGGWAPIDLVDTEDRLMMWYDDADLPAAQASARLTCPCCAAQVDETQRRRMLRRPVACHHGQTVDEHGRVTGTAPATTVYSFLWCAGESPLRTLGYLAELHLKAKNALEEGDESAMRQWYRDQAVRPYVSAMASSIESISRQDLFGNSAVSAHDAGTVPAWAQFLVMSVDVQWDRVYWLVLAAGPEDRLAMVEVGVDEVDEESVKGQPPSREASWRCWDRVHRRAQQGWMSGDGRRMVPVECGIDCGDRADEVVPWAQTRGWRAVRGLGERQESHYAGRQTGLTVARIEGWGEIKRSDRDKALGSYDIYWIVRERAFRRCHEGLLRVEGPGCWQLPRGIAAKSPSEWIARHLVGVRLGRRTPTSPAEWLDQAGSRHDVLDCAGYANGLVALHREWRATQGLDAVVSAHPDSAPVAVSAQLTEQPAVATMRQRPAQGPAPKAQRGPPGRRGRGVLAMGRRGRRK